MGARERADEIIDWAETVEDDYTGKEGD